MTKEPPGAIAGKIVADRLSALENAVRYLLENIDTSHFSPLCQVETDREIRDYIRSLGFYERR